MAEVYSAYQLEEMLKQVWARKTTKGIKLYNHYWISLFAYNTKDEAQKMIEKVNDTRGWHAITHKIDFLGRPIFEVYIRKG